MAGLKSIKPSSFKKVEQIRKQSTPTNMSDFINQAEGETSQAPLKKSGAPQKAQAQKRVCSVLLNFTERELLKIQEMAEERSMKRAEFIRFKIFN